MQEALRFLSPGAEPVDRADFVVQARLLRRGSEASSRGLSLTIRGLRKSFGDNEVLRGIDLHIPAGQSVAMQLCAIMMLGSESLAFARIDPMFRSAVYLAFVAAFIAWPLVNVWLIVKLPEKAPAAIGGRAISPM